MDARELPTKAGRLPRRRYTTGQIQRYLEAQARSGLGVERFCREQRISASAFYRWKQGPRKPRSPTPAFEEVSLPAWAGSAWVAELTLPGGAVLRWSAQADWAQLHAWVSPLLRP